MHETTDQIRRRVRRLPPAPRVPSRLEVWAWSPIFMFRVALVLVYAGLVYFGVVSFIAGVPAFRLTAPDGYTSLWAGALTIGAAVAGVGSLVDSRRFHRVELIGSVFAFVPTMTYAFVLHLLAFGYGDINRQAVAAAVTVVTLLPGCRMLWLLGQLGKRRAH